MRSLLIILIFKSHFGICQGSFDYDSTYLNQRNSISLNAFGLSSLIGITYERLLGNHFMIEVGGGYDKQGLEGGIGMRYIFNKTINSGKYENRKFKKHIGLRHSYHVFNDNVKVISHSVVIGIALYSKNKLNFSFDVGPSYIHTLPPDIKNYLNVNADPPFMYINLNFKVGYRFGKKKEWQAKH